MKKKINLLTKQNVMIAICCTFICLVTIISIANALNKPVIVAGGEYAPNDKVVIHLSLADITGESDELAILEGEIQYDSTIFKNITTNDFDVANGIENIVFDTNTNRFKARGIATDNPHNDVFTVTLTVQDHVV